MQAVVAQLSPDFGLLLTGARSCIEDALQSPVLPVSVQRQLHESMEAEGRLLDSDSSAALGLLLLLSFESAGGADPSAAAPAAASMQFLLAAGDALDDIQDGVEPKVPRAEAAAACEQVAAFLALSHHAITSVHSPQIPLARGAAAVRRLADLELQALGGQLLDSAPQRETVGIAEALRVAQLKSGSLGRCAAEVGAALACDDEHLIHLHGEFGEALGTIHQLMNDIAGVWPAGPASTDLAHFKQTTALAFVSNVRPGVNESADRLRALAGLSGPGSEQELRRLALRSGAIHFTWAVAALFKVRALRVLGQIVAARPDSRLGELLRA